MTALELALNGMTKEEKEDPKIKTAILSERADTIVDWVTCAVVAGGVAYAVGRPTATMTFNLINKFL